jgi:hypothetical protein
MPPEIYTAHRPKAAPKSKAPLADRDAAGLTALQRNGRRILAAHSSGVSSEEKCALTHWTHIALTEFLAAA